MNCLGSRRAALTMILMTAFAEATAAECPVGKLADNDIYVAYDDGSFSSFHTSSDNDVLITTYDTETGAAEYRYLAAGSVFTLADWIFVDDYPKLEFVSAYQQDIYQYVPISPDVSFSVIVRDTYVGVANKGLLRALATWGSSRSLAELTVQTRPIEQLSIGSCSYDAIPFTIAIQDIEPKTLEPTDLLPHTYHASYLPALGIEIYQGFIGQEEDAERVAVAATYIGHSPPE